MNGPFSIIAAHQGEMMGLTDRIKLRPLTAATDGDILFLSSEEAAIRCVVSRPGQGVEPSRRRASSRQTEE